MTAIAVIGALAACKSSPAEPDAPGAASAAGVAAEAVTPLVWDVPPTWTVSPPQRDSARRAAYHVPKAGDAKSEAEVVVVFFGTGSVGDVDKAFASWSAEFQSEDGAPPKRAPLAGGKFAIETLEAAGKYKVALGPEIGPQKKSPMQMLRDHFRLVGAVVKTTNRGNWFFNVRRRQRVRRARRVPFDGPLGALIVAGDVGRCADSQEGEAAGKDLGIGVLSLQIPIPSSRLLAFL